MNYVKLLVIIVICAFLNSCDSRELNRDVIAFSCIKCEGCVENSLIYINKHHLDSRFKIILDTNCYEGQKSLILPLHFTHMDSKDIEKKFGDFGNFILIDSTSHRTEFMTDMNLRDFIE